MFASSYILYYGEYAYMQYKDTIDAGQDRLLQIFSILLKL